MGFFKKTIKTENYYFDMNWSYLPVQQDGYAEESFTFRQIYLQYVQLMAEGWFDDSNKTLQDVFQNSQDVEFEKLQSPPEDGEFNILGEPGVQESLLNTQKRFENAKRISWKESALGRSWEQKLTQLGVNLFTMPSPQDSSVEIVSGPWTLFDDETPLPIFGEVWQDSKTGKEFIYWFFDAIVKTRYSIETQDLHPTHAFFMPAMFQRAGYASETIFPSSMVRIRDRIGEFAVSNKSQIPSLAFHTERDYIVTTLISEDNALSQRLDWSPETTRYGYLIDDHIPFLEENEIITKVVDALPKVASILMDGYCNWNETPELGFQMELFLDVDLKNIQLEPFELGLYVPGTAYGRLVWKSMMFYSAVTNLQNDEKLLSQDSNSVEILNHAFWRLIHRGCGSVPLHCVNTYFFTLHNSNQLDIAAYSESDKDLTRRILNYFATYCVDDQDSNALSNLARFELSWREPEKAISIATLGLMKLESKSVYYQNEIWQDLAQNRLPIKLELLITISKAQISLNHESEGRKLLQQVIEESEQFGFSGSEYQEAFQLLSQLS